MSELYIAIGATVLWSAAVWIAAIAVLTGVSVWNCPQQLRWRM